jgi:Zn-dependent M28 family amino/carboxypeptidase
VLKKKHIKSKEAYEKLADKDLDNKVLIIDKDSFADFKANKRYKAIKENDLDASALVYLHSDDLVWGTSTEALKHPVLEAKRSAFPDSPQIVTVNVKQKLKTSEKTQNVVSYIEGRENPDSFIVFTAHYDHLGRMGSETYFPGANDNASGVSMLLNLARYFSSSRQTPDYSVVFIAFTGEEAGLLGSHQFVENPMLGLEKIEFLINLDMMGTGKDGMMTVNGKVFDDAFNKLVKINEKGNYFDTLDKRGEAANSDHHFFYKNEVPCFFCYLQEDYPHYHDVNDNPKNLSYAGYKPAFNLFVDFVESYNKKRRGRR